ncbi:MAG: L-aspartate oxidase [Planctomycetota bacterium]
MGSGVAGLRASLEFPPSMGVLVATKGSAEQSSSHEAQGGIAVSLGVEDSSASHVADTLEVGCGLCDEVVVKEVVAGAREAFADLVRWGARFDTEKGEWALGLEGGHSHPRILHADGAQTGKEIIRILLHEVRKRQNITLMERLFLVDFLVVEGVLAGALFLRGGEALVVRAPRILLASGGCGQVWRETTNPPVATGDGMAAAHRAGVVLRDMEFMQFHPTTLYVAGAARMLVSEAVRGAGARLIDRKGERFMEDEHPMGDLAPRDVVSRAILRRIRQTRDTRVYLDLRSLRDFATAFPALHRTCLDVGLDPAKTPVPVHPSAHYHIGGLKVDLEGRTSLPGLWSSGEAAASGLHGANRLASNSLLEGLVLGARAARSMTGSQGQPSVPGMRLPMPLGRPFTLDTADLRGSLKALMWRLAGIERDASGLDEASQRLMEWSGMMEGRVLETQEQWEFSNMLSVGKLVVEAARARTESRGVHYRTDHPATDPQWSRHVEG